ncbi:MAG: hypothetical protein F6K41_33450 [Symploca sp. SIO3E6]|nr:hypothetical protein [Caldora sp. SIO3E6]
MQLAIPWVVLKRQEAGGRRQKAGGSVSLIHSGWQLLPVGRSEETDFTCS